MWKWLQKYYEIYIYVIIIYNIIWLDYIILYK